MTSALQFQFDNRFVADLPGDPEQGNFRRQIQNACYSHVDPKPVIRPELVAYASEVAELLDLSPAACESNEFVEVFSGNRKLDGMAPYATCYGGHQFGNWAGQLGDGRAINLGEIVNAQGERWALQLKGAGPTPYSRTADGLAVLRSSVREFLCSEAMAHLGVPTTRALSLVTTGENVVRDILYDGNPAPEPGAVVCRVAPSFTRFGHFEILTARREIDLLRRFVDYTIRQDFPELEASDDPKERTVRWFNEVCARTARMIVEWMRVGFVHGVMNTDNMSILGLTINYGPYGWLEDYDPEWTPNTTDAANRRYRFGQQAPIAQWNLLQLANAIYPLVDEVEPLQQALASFGTFYQREYAAMMQTKLGFTTGDDGDRELIAELLSILAAEETDMTIFFRRLATLDINAPNPAVLSDAYYSEDGQARASERTERWLNDYAARLAFEGVDQDERRAAMNRVNPKYVLRNYLAQLAIDKADEGDFGLINELLDVLRNPYAEQPGFERHAAKRPDWARDRAGCSMLSCSS